MRFSNGHAPDDPLLVRYLLGSVAEDETERLDERSIADDQFAAHLRAVEHDLVDAYVRGELSGETLDRFRAHYMASPARRDKIRFAETLLAYQTRAAATTAPARPGRRVFAVPRTIPRWALAAAAVLVLAAGSLLAENLRLRHQVTTARAARAALEERERQLQRQLDEQRASNGGTARELARVRESLAQIQDRMAAEQQPGTTFMPSFVLLPATRGAGAMPTIVLPPGTRDVRLQLTLESDDFPTYRAALQNPATDQRLWRSGPLTPRAAGDLKSVSLTIAASLLRREIYSIELEGTSAHGADAFVSSYAFRVVTK